MSAMIQMVGIIEDVERYSLNNIEYIKNKKDNIGLSSIYYDTG